MRNSCRTNYVVREEEKISEKVRHCKFIVCSSSDQGSRTSKPRRAIESKTSRGKLRGYEGEVLKQNLEVANSATEGRASLRAWVQRPSIPRKQCVEMDSRRH